MARKSITRRWLVNGLGVIAVLLLLFEVIFGVAVRNYYYQSVSQILAASAERLNGILENSFSQNNFSFEERAREVAENFPDKERIEMQVVDASGRILVSSSGFEPEGEAADAFAQPDYALAMKDSDGSGVWHGRNDGGENVMAMTRVIVDADGNRLGAVRYLVSLSNIDHLILMLVAIMLLFGAAILFFVMLSSSYFVSSIIHPVTEIGQAARRIALGEYDYRIEKQYDDEIGELCDTLNYMAGEIDTAERMKNDFISSVSHELRTPLTAIKGWSETLREAGDTDSQLTRKGLEVISGEAERLSSIVEELLDFSRMQGGRITMKFERMDLLAELEEAVFLFRDRAAREGIDLIYVEAADLSPVLGDHDRLKQVFINIIDNAIKYSNRGDKVRVEAADMGAHIQVVVSDSGVGISKEDLPRIKNKFFKANNTRPGSGIGLALADEIIRRHKGRLEIDSEEGVGTTVTITLPVAPPDSGAHSEPQTPEEPPAAFPLTPPSDGV